MESSSSEPDNDGKELFGSPKLSNKKALKLSLQGIDVNAMLQYGKAFTRQFICDLPPIRVFEATGTPKVFDVDTEDDQISCKSISTYPMLGDGRRDGDPIADRFKVRLCQNRAWIALADGCNWGSRAFNAAKAAIAAYDEHVDQHSSEMSDLQDTGHILLRAFAKAHNKIFEGKDDIWEAGTTTLFGGVLLEIDPPKGADAKWALLCANVGDCKAFLYSAKTKNVIDITSGDTIYVKDRCDPGGRLGPYLDGGTPDLRNLRLYYTTVSSGDIICAVSDGVHDNLDPEQLGVRPMEIDDSVDDVGWDKLPGTVAERLKTGFRCQKLKELIEDMEGEKTPTAIANMLMEYCTKITSKSREYMEKNPQSPHPSDYKDYPGKMDHTTCVILAIPSLGGGSEKKAKSPSGSRKKESGKSTGSKKSHSEKKEKPNSNDNATAAAPAPEENDETPPPAKLKGSSDSNNNQTQSGGSTPKSESAGESKRRRSSSGGVSNGVKKSNPNKKAKNGE